MEKFLDLTILPVSYSRTEVQRQLKDLYTAMPPRHAARGRSSDRLVLCYHPSGEPLDENTQSKLLERLASLYYKTAGPVTSTMRVVAENLNEFLLKRNVRTLAKGDAPFKGAESGSLLTMMVQRPSASGNAILYIGQCGPAYIFHGSENGVHSCSDPQRAGRGLGIGNKLSIHYQQIELQNHDFIFLARTPSQVGDLARFQGVHGQPLEKLHRHLLNQMNVKQDSEAEALVLLHALTGTGQLQLVSAKMDSQAVKREVDGSELTKRTPPTQQNPVSPLPTTSPSLELPAVDGSQSAPMQTEAVKPLPPSQATSEKPVKIRKAEQTDVVNPKRQPARKNPLNVLLNNVLNFLHGFGRRVSPVFVHLGTEKPNDTPAPLPQSVMAFIAVAVPVVVVAVTSMVYLQRGLGSLNRTYYQQAQTAAVSAVGENDPVNLRKIWLQTIDYLDKAEKYQVTGETKSLRTLADASLDDLEGITRLDFQPILAGRLAGTIDIRRILIVGEDLYLYNASNGDVLHAEHTAQGYELDPAFDCRPGPNIGPLVDVVAYSVSPDAKGAVLGMDADGKLIYCKPKSDPIFETLPSPDNGWSSPKTILYDVGKLYVLDPGVDKIWVYSQDDKGLFSKPPDFFFSEKIPALKSATSMVNHRGDFYILFNDGHLITCVYDVWYGTPTRCEDPALFTEARSDKSIGGLIKYPDGNPILFNQIIYAPPPDPSIYLLDPNKLSTFHLSLRLTLQGQFRPQQEQAELYRTASAFTVGQNRTLFLAVGNNVLAATLP
ncbi:MAG: hypothetical protein WCI88_11725 [Chloroflexota bacterium]